MKYSRITVSPESLGIPSGKIMDFINFLKESKYNMHSFMIVKDGKTALEAYYAPFKKEDKKRLYSCSKTICALAVGKLVGDGLVSVSDPLINYFPDVKYCDPVMKTVTIEEVLTMTLPMSACPYNNSKNGLERSDDIVIKSSWVEAFFSGIYVDESMRGKFRYASHGSYMLSALVERLTGVDVAKYLRPIFDQIGVSEDIDLVKSPEDIFWGASGMLCSMRDFSLMGELLLNRGYMNGKQLLPRDYMEKATSPLVSTMESYFKHPYGYGYQIWGQKYGFGMHGMLGQNVFCYPDKNMLFVHNSNHPQTIRAKLYEEVSKIYEATENAPLKEGADYELLKKTVSEFKIDRSLGAPHSDIEKRENGKTYCLFENPMGISYFRLVFEKEKGAFVYYKDGKERTLYFGYGDYYDTTFPETKYYSLKITESANRELRTLSTGSWISENELAIVADVSDTMYGTLDVRIKFDSEGARLVMSKIGEAIFAEYQGEALGTAN